MDTEGKAKGGMSPRRERWVTGLLIACLAVVGFWEVMANRSRSPFKPFDLTVEDFQDFKPSPPGWIFKSLPVKYDPIEPNLVAFEISPVRAPSFPDAAAPVSVSAVSRLVHGYNMPDCMRIKGYTVEEVKESLGTRDLRPGAEGTEGQRHKGTKGGGGERRPGTLDLGPETRDRRPETGGVGVSGYGSDGVMGDSSRQDQPGEGQTSNPPISQSSNPPPPPPPRLGAQAWRLTSGAGDVSVAVTSMLKAGDFSVTGVDVRSMAFPRIGVPDDPNWVPRGLTRESLRHPVEGLKVFFRAKWNNARCDWATFLKLKHPAWASEELLTLVSVSQGPPLRPGEEEAALRQVMAAHAAMLGELKKRRERRPETGDIRPETRDQRH